MPADVSALLVLLHMMDALVTVWEAVMPMIFALLVALIIMLASVVFVKIVFK